jgi:hypothetical protein
MEQSCDGRRDELAVAFRSLATFTWIPSRNPRIYSRGGRVQGTKGLWLEDNQSLYLEGRGMNPAWEPFEQLWDEFEHPLWQQYRAFGIRGGHGGMDYLC